MHHKQDFFLFITSTVSSLWERVVLIRLCQYLVRNNTMKYMQMLIIGEMWNSSTP